MKIQLLMTEEAELAALRYATLVEGWRALYARALDAADFGTPRQLRRVEEEAYAIARTFLEQEARAITEATTNIAYRAYRTTLEELSVETSDEIPEAVSEHLNAAESYLRHELSVQIERDIAFLKHSLRRTILQVNLAARSKGVPHRAALMEYRIGNAAELHFFFHDRGNQKWPSRKFVRAVWRHHLLAVYNEVVLMTLADHGLEKAQVSHLNPTSQYHGQVIAMSAGSSLPIYAEIRNEVFHPNSDAILRKADE